MEPQELSEKVIAYWHGRVEPVLGTTVITEEMVAEAIANDFVRPDQQPAPPAED